MPIAIGVTLVVLAFVGTYATNPTLKKSAIVLFFILFVALAFMPGAERSGEPVDATDDDDEDDGRRSWLARLAWAAWACLAAVACFSLAEFASARLPPLAIPLRGLSVLLVLFGAYKLIFGGGRDNR